MFRLLPYSCKTVVRSWIYFARDHCSIQYRDLIEQEEHQWLSTTNERYSVLIQRMDRYVEDVFYKKYPMK